MRFNAMFNPLKLNLSHSRSFEIHSSQGNSFESGIITARNDNCSLQFWYLRCVLNLHE